MKNYFTTKKGVSANENNEVDDNIEEIIYTYTQSEHQPESRKRNCADMEKAKQLVQTHLEIQKIAQKHGL